MGYHIASTGGGKNRKKLKNRGKGKGLLTLADWESRRSPKPDYKPCHQ